MSKWKNKYIAKAPSWIMNVSFPAPLFLFALIQAFLFLSHRNISSTSNTPPAFTVSINSQVCVLIFSPLGLCSLPWLWFIKKPTIDIVQKELKWNIANETPLTGHYILMDLAHCKLIQQELVSCCNRYEQNLVY